MDRGHIVAGGPLRSQRNLSLGQLQLGCCDGVLRRPPAVDLVYFFYAIAFRQRLSLTCR